MAKKQKNYRFSEETIERLHDLINLEFELDKAMYEQAGKGAIAKKMTETEMIEWLIYQKHKTWK